MKTALLKSPLRYPGGKQKLLKEIDKFIPYNDKDIIRYREPFLGGGSVFLHLLNNKNKTNITGYWLNDLYEPLLNFWKVLKNDTDNLVLDLRNIHNSLNEQPNKSEALAKAYFNGARKFFGDEKNNKYNIKKGSLYFFMNRTSFSGLGLSGGFSKAAFNSRFTESSIDKLMSIGANIRHSSIQFTNYDYSKMFLEEPSGKAWMFMDPPYDIESKTLYGKNGSTHSSFNHEEFAAKCKEIDSNKILWLITYNDNPKIRELFSSWANIHEVSVGYHMNNLSKRKTELFITNY